MKNSHSSITIEELCKLFGNSRQAYYQNIRFNEHQQFNIEIILQLVSKIRKRKPRCGGRKLFIELKKDFILHTIKIGRDAFFDILRKQGLLIRKRRIRIITTMSFHWLRKYPNLIRDLKPTLANQLWVSDITYIETATGVVYLSLITDGYSRKIVGWYLSSDLKSYGSIKALEMALSNEQLTKDLIHHSDRGVQYCSENYVLKLKENNILISMTENGDPRENAIAERVNGILKDEWLNDLVLSNIEVAREEIKEIIYIYNTERLHMSLDYSTPEQAHQKQGEIKRRWKTYYKEQENSSAFDE